MNDDLLELERELQSLRPRRPGPRMAAGIAAALAQSLPASHRQSATSWTSWKWVNWGVAAALVALMALFTPDRPRSPARAPLPAGSPVAGYAPVAAERTIYSAKDEGVVTLADGTSARQLRSYYVDTITWRDPASNASLRWSVPQEEVRVVPIRVN